MAAEAAIILKTASLLRSKHWQTIVNAQKSRFGDHLGPLFDKLESDLMFQMAQHIDAPGMRMGDLTNLGVTACGPLLADQIEEMIEKCDVKVPKKDAKFTVPQGQKPLDVASQLLNIPDVQDATLWAGRQGMQYRIATFPVQHLMVSISDYVMALDTLANGAPDVKFIDRFLEQHLDDVKYWENGYPRDILVTDVHFARTANRPVYGIAVSTDFASSYLIEDVGNVSDVPHDFRQILNNEYKPGPGSDIDRAWQRNKELVESPGQP